MQATKPTKLIFGSNSDSPLSEYLRRLIVWKDNQPVFSKFGILSDPSLLFKVGESLGNLIPKSSNAVCLLANSGIPVGVVAALSQSLPIYFFHRAGWQREGNVLFVLPQPAPALEMAILDSHVRFGFTSRACFLDLTEHYGTRIGAICAPILFEPLFTSRSPTEYRFLGNYESVLSIINDIIGESTEATQSRLLNIESDFWAYPNGSQPERDEFRARSPSGKWRFLLRPGSEPPTILVSERTQKLISTRITPTDTGIWDFFQDYSFIKEICEVVGQKISLEEYDYVVGIQALGLALTVALAYFNKNRFRGHLIHWLGQQGFLPEVPQWQNKKVLVVSVRMQFGTYLADVVSEIQRLGGHVNHALVAVPDFRTNNLFNRFRQNSLSNLSRSGIQFFRLS